MAAPEIEKFNNSKSNIAYFYTDVAAPM